MSADLISLNRTANSLTGSIKRCARRRIAVVVFCILSAQTICARPISLWCVKHGEATVYLLGSIHALRPDDYPLAEEIEAAFIAADKTVFEVDLHRGSALESASLIKEKGIYIAPQTIESEISSETYQQLLTYLQINNLSIDDFRSLRPWMISLKIGMIEIAKAGYSLEYGIDNHYQKKARQLGKPILQLESVEQQIALLAGESAKNQEISLRALLVEVDELQPLLRKLLSAWHRGAMDEMYELSLRQTQDYPELEEQLDRLLTQRNRKMALQIQDFLDSKGIYFVVIGALHMGGPDGILALLGEDHTIVQLHHSDDSRK